MKITRSFKSLRGGRTPWAYRSLGVKREYYGPGPKGTAYVLGLWWWTWHLRTWA